MKNLKITTSEIARICGVSQGTVDRALNNRSDIKAETKQKILEVAKQYGYREMISTPPDKIVGQIGIVVFHLKNEYFSELITETEYALREEGLGATVMMSHFDKQYEIECIRNLYNMGVEGIILCSVNSGTEFTNYLRLLDVPIVAVGNRVEGLPFVGIDDFAAMRDMTSYVLERPLQKLIYFSPALRYSDAYAQRERYEGFLSAVGSQPYTVATSIDEIPETGGEDTVVLCSTDYYALQVYFKTRGMRIVGFDNMEILDHYKISMDSVGYSMTEIARGAVDVIKGRRRGSVSIAHRIVSRTT